MRGKLLASVAAAAAIGLLSAWPVAAEQPNRYSLGAWSDWTISGACTFDVNVHPVVDRRYEIDFFGRGRLAVLITGTQTVELTNADTGATIALHTVGPAWSSTDPQISWLNGHWLVSGDGYLWWRTGHLDGSDIGGDSPGRITDVCALLAG